MEGTGKPFDVRQLISCSITEDEIVQAGYTITNRMAALLGDINFGEIFTTPFARLVPSLIPNIDAARDLFRNPERVKVNHQLLAEIAGGFSFLTLYEGGYDAVLAEVQEVLAVLLQLDGIRWPILTDADSADRLYRGIEALIAGAGFLTYRNLFEVAHNAPEVTEDVIDGVHRGFAVGCIYLNINNCKRASDGCHFYAGSTCNLALDRRNASLATVAAERIR